MFIQRTSNYQNQNFKGTTGQYPAKEVSEYAKALERYFKKLGVPDSEIPKRVAEFLGG